MTALKSYFGNLGASGGAVEMVASVMAFAHGRIPTTLNYTQPDPACPVNVVAGEPRETQHSPRHCLASQVQDKPRAWGWREREAGGGRPQDQSAASGWWPAAHFAAEHSTLNIQHSTLKGRGRRISRLRRDGGRRRALRQNIQHSTFNTQH